MKRTIVYPILTLALLLALGTEAYHQLEGWSRLDALYFSTVTLTTIGYGDLAPKTDAGKLFTVGFVLVGVSVFLYILIQLGTHMVQERIDRTYDKMYDKIYVKLPIRPIRFKDEAK